MLIEILEVKEANPDVAFGSLPIWAITIKALGRITFKMILPKTVAANKNQLATYINNNPDVIKQQLIPIFEQVFTKEAMYEMWVKTFNLDTAVVKP